ncbi:MAG: hypothetical protein ACRDPX_12455 [Gaiellaceae bacterium]
MRLPTALAVTVTVVVAAASGSTGAGAPARLTWAPPALSDPVTISVTNANRRLFLDDARDYRLDVVEPLTRELWIEGGRNVVVVGGHITVGELGGDTAYHDNTGVKVRFGDPSGTVHLEGLLVDGPFLSDGIAVATGRDVQVQNVRVERVYDNLKQAHADCVQIQRGVGHLRLDRFTCSTQRQGIFLGDGGPIRSVDLRRVDLLGAPGAHLLWQTTPSYDVTVSDLWLGVAPEFRAWAPFGYWVYPQKDGRTYAGSIDRKRRAVVSRDGKRLWFVGSRISGVVRKAAAGARREFVPPGVAGMAYASPGYARR